MALAGESVRRPLPVGNGSDEEVSGGAMAAPVFLAADKDRPVDPMIWVDEERMKRELLAWAKAVASMAISKNTSSPSSYPSTRRSG